MFARKQRQPNHQQIAPIPSRRESMNWTTNNQPK